MFDKLLMQPATARKLPVGKLPHQGQRSRFISGFHLLTQNPEGFQAAARLLKVTPYEEQRPALDNIA